MKLKAIEIGVWIYCSQIRVSNAKMTVIVATSIMW